jgi:DNA repair exonuclease SbcCD ATPase subunit
MPLKDWPPKEDWPPKNTPRSSHEEVAKDEKRPEQPWAQVTEVQASIDTFTRERATFEEIQNKLRESHREIEGMKQSVDQAAALRTELEQIRGVAGQLGDDYAKLRDASREAREDSAAATDVVQEVEKKLGSLGQLVNDIQAKLDVATRWRDEFGQETARMEKDGRALATAISTHVERLELEKKQFEVFEQRIEALIQHERHLSYLPERLDEFSRTFEALTDEVDELRRKQERLTQPGQVHDREAALEAQLTGERIHAVDTLEGRLAAMQATVSDMDEKFTALIARQAELALKLDEGEQKMKALADRDAVVIAVKEALDNLHEMSARSKADTHYLSDLALLRSRLEELLTLTEAAEQKIRRKI